MEEKHTSKPMYTIHPCFTCRCINRQKLLIHWMVNRAAGQGGYCSFVPEKLLVKLLLFDISLQLPLDSRVRAQCIIHDEVVQDLHPWCVLRQVIIILCCYFLHLGANEKEDLTLLNAASEFYFCGSDRPVTQLIQTSKKKNPTHFVMLII